MLKMLQKLSSGQEKYRALLTANSKETLLRMTRTFGFVLEYFRFGHVC